MSKKKSLDGFVMKPFYILKRGDLVRVKDFARDMVGLVGIIVSKEDYNTACRVLFSNGVTRKMMKFTLEKIDEEE